MPNEKNWVINTIQAVRAIVLAAAPSYQYAVCNVPVKLSTRKSRVAGSFRGIRAGALGVNLGYITMNTKINNTPERFHHGRIWQDWMVKLGQDPKSVTHSYDLQEAFGNYYTVIACSKGHEIKLRPGIVKKMKKGVRFSCRLCGHAGMNDPLTLNNVKK